jgi:PhnB protein
VKAILQGFHAITPRLLGKNASAAIELYKKAFGAVEVNRMAERSGRLMDAELQIGYSQLFLSDEFPGMAYGAHGGAPPSKSLHRYVEE